MGGKIVAMLYDNLSVCSAQLHTMIVNFKSQQILNDKWSQLTSLRLDLNVDCTKSEFSISLMAEARRCCSSNETVSVFKRTLLSSSVTPWAFSTSSAPTDTTPQSTLYPPQSVPHGLDVHEKYGNFVAHQGKITGIIRVDCYW